MLERAITNLLDGGPKIICHVVLKINCQEIERQKVEILARIKKRQEFEEINMYEIVTINITKRNIYLYIINVYFIFIFI